MKKRMVLLACFMIMNQIFAQSLMVNEVLSSNCSILEDLDGEYSDWIEIYNGTESSIDLEGYCLSDNVNNLKKWRFPSYTIQANQYLVVMASDKDLVRSRANPHFHTNFKLSKDGETLSFSDPTGQVINQIELMPTSCDIAQGFVKDSDAWTLLSQATPGAANEVQAFSGILQPPVFSHVSGLYASAFNLEIVSPDNGHVYYTLDGSVPTETSLPVNGPITIQNNSVVRAIVIMENLASSRVVSRTFLINETLNLPVISIISDPENLWNWETGIYVKGPNAESNSPYKKGNFWQDWEKPVHLELIEPDGTLGFSIDGGMKIAGHYSVAPCFKSLVFYARSKYGDDAIDYPVFPDKAIDSFQAIMVRNSGNDWNQTLFRDGFMQSLARDMNVATQAFRPALVFINGEFWAIQNIRERVNEHYVASNFDTDPDNLDLISISWGTKVIEGDKKDYDDLMNFVRNNDLNTSQALQVLESWIDIDNLLTYFAAEIYFGNSDWPDNNMRYWRPRIETGKWRWIMVDTDHGFGRARFGNHPELYNSLEEEAIKKSELFRRLLDNDKIKNRFVNIFADHMNTTFLPDPLIARIDSFQAIIAPEMNRLINRWEGVDVSDIGDAYGIKDIAEWHAFVDSMKVFAQKRIPAIQALLVDADGYYVDSKDRVTEYNNFDITGKADITCQISETSGGRIKLNQLYLQTFPWTGTYFKGVPVQLTALPKPGYRFAGWQGMIEEDQSFALSLISDTVITAIFEKDSALTDPIIINEFNYNSAPEFDVEDWVELYNLSDRILDLSQWVLKDSSDENEFIFPNGILIEPNGYLVLSRNKVKFSNHFSEVHFVTGDFSFGLSNSGDQIRLYNRQNQLIDWVIYDDEFPWPLNADGKGSALALVDPALDNMNVENWKLSEGHGTPGFENKFSTTAVNENHPYCPHTFRLCQNYPNPFNPETQIRYELSQSVHVSLRIYNMLGREVLQLIHDFQEAGVYTVQLDASALPTGIYFYHLFTPEFQDTKKMMIIK